MLFEMCPAQESHKGGRLYPGLRLALLVFLLVLTGCQTTPQVVKIGLVAPFEGRDRALGYDAIYAARLAIREANAAGGVGGARIALVALDDGGLPDLAEGAARSLTLDPAVVAVIGHARLETTAVARPVYAAAGLPLLALGEPPFAPFNPVALPAGFRKAYQGVSPFDETAGPLAGPTYDAVGLVLTAIGAAGKEGDISRESVANFLPKVTHEGITGVQPTPTP